ncbi:redoxin family protein [bacterium]|nr:redoxin family protein [bacterium]
MFRRTRTMMTPPLVAAIFAMSGCGVETTHQISPAASPTASSSSNAPAEIKSNIEKSVAAESATADTEKEKPAPAPESVVTDAKPVEPKALAAASPSAAPAAVDGVKLVPAKWNEYLEFVKPKDGKKFTLVDAWATWCAPCKENFPHVVEMHEKYGPKGLQVISLSMDDLTDAKAVREATEFLISKKAAFTNLIMNESQDVAFDKLEISAIPSVFLFDAQGKEVHRFTLEDPNDQFTYDQVEKAIEALLEGKPIPSFKKSPAK